MAGEGHNKGRYIRRGRYFWGNDREESKSDEVYELRPPMRNGYDAIESHSSDDDLDSASDAECWRLAALRSNCSSCHVGEGKEAGQEGEPVFSDEEESPHTPDEPIVHAPAAERIEDDMEPAEPNEEVEWNMLAEEGEEDLRQISFLEESSDDIELMSGIETLSWLDGMFSVRPRVSSLAKEMVEDKRVSRDPRLNVQGNSIYANLLKDRVL